MSLELSLFIGLLLHLAGDYLLQNDFMAQYKTKRNDVAFLHAFLYSFGFIFLVPSVYCYAIIIGTHYFIDRYRLATLWIKLVNWNWKSENFGFDNEKPIFISIWLMIIIDNVFHVIINSCAIGIYYKYFL